MSTVFFLNGVSPRVRLDDRRLDLGLRGRTGALVSSRKATAMAARPPRSKAYTVTPSWLYPFTLPSVSSARPSL